MPSFKEKPWKGFNPLDLNLTLLIKYISDWSALLRKLSPFSSIIFILLNVRSFITDKRAIITAALFFPALAITPSSEILRFILSVFVLWIFLKKFDHPYNIYSPWVAVIICLYTPFVFAGIFFPENYLLSDNSFRYKFVFETHNALTVYALFSFTYLLNYFLEAPKLKPVKWLNIFVFVTMVLWIIIFLMIKSRLYLTISFVMVVILAIKNLRQSRTFAILPVCYALAFLGVSQISQLVIRPADHVVAVNKPEPVQTAPAVPRIASHAADSSTSKPADTGKTVARVNAKKPNRGAIGSGSDSVSVASSKRLVVNKKNLDSIRAQEALRLVDNKRVFSFSGTGREKMVALFVDLFKDFGWKQFIYQNHTKAYLERKSKLPNINIYASTLTENSYLIILLSTGYIGLFVFLYIFGVYIIYFIKQRTWFSLFFFGLLMAVWFYEETVTYPFSMIAQLFALATIHRFERKNYASSHHH